MDRESTQSYLDLHSGGSSSLSLDISYFPLQGSAQTSEAQLVEEFQKFILPCHLRQLRPSSPGSEVEITLMIHSSVRLPASSEGVAFQFKEDFRMTLFERSSGVCEKYEEEGRHYHYLCKVVMRAPASAAVSRPLLMEPVINEDGLPRASPASVGLSCEHGGQQLLQNPANINLNLQRIAELILPEEIWLIILDKLDDSTDRFNCFKTCKLFKRLLGGSPLLEMTFPYLFLHLDKPDVLNMRKVSSKLKRSLDNQLKHHPSLRPATDENPSRYQQNKAFLRKWREFNGNTFTINFGQIEVIQGHRRLRPEDNVDQETFNSFWNRWTTLINLKGTALLTAHLTLEIPWYINLAHGPLTDPGDEGELNLKWEKIFDMIRDLGPYVLYLTIKCPVFITSALDACRMYRLTQVCLSNAPNLRSLTFITEQQDWDWQHLLQNETIRNPLPDHFHLETIIFSKNITSDRESYTIPEILMAKYSRQLGKVKSAFLSDFDLLDFPTLTELRATVRHLDVIKLARMKIPNLKTLSFPFIPRSDFISRHLLDVLNNFPNLTVLKIEFRLYSSLLSERALLQDFNSLPGQPGAKIKVVQFKHVENISYNFLTRFPNLRVLHIWKGNGRDSIPRVTVGNGQEDCDLHEVVEGDLSVNPASSNVWETIPSLEEITYQHNSIRKVWSRPAE